MISGTPAERGSSFNYLGVNICEDLTWGLSILRGHRKCIDSQCGMEMCGEGYNPPLSIK